jgi:hypothetical protein
MNNANILQLKEGFLLREIAGRIVVLPVEDSMDLNLMICLNSTGRFLWERLKTGASAQELKDALMEAYDVSREQAQTDVDMFIEKLMENGFLK